MPPPPSDLRPLIVRYRNQTRTIRDRIEAYVRRAWPAQVRDATIERFVTLVVPVVLAGQVRVAALTDAYLARYEELILGTRVTPAGVGPDDVSIETLRGVPADEVYRRPAVTVWTALANGVAYDQAHKNGLERALDLAATDIQLAKTHTSRRVLREKRNVVGYRRVLEGTHSCGLCVVASTQRYRKAELMPIHPSCDCGVAPIYGSEDPGQLIEAARLDDVDTLLTERFGDDARRPEQMRAALVTHQHGELGPVLGVRGQKFTAL